MAVRPGTADLLDALSVLSWEEFQVLATHLGKGVDLPTLRRIAEDHHTADARILHSIQAWLDYEFEVSWEKIILALQKIGKNADAQHLKLLYCPDLTLTCDTSRDPPDAYDGAALPQTPREDAARMRKAATRAAQLSEKFRNVLTKAKFQLFERESEPRFLTIFRTELKTLPVSTKYEHLKFLWKETPALNAAKSVDEIFDVIDPYMTHTDYSLLKFIITKFCKRGLKKMMNNYILELEEFERMTTVYDVPNTIRRGNQKRKREEVELRTRYSPTVCTLHKVRKISEDIAEEAALEPYCHFQLAVHASAVTIVLAFPEHALSLVAHAMTPGFLMTHNIESVSIDEKPLQSYIEEVSKNVKGHYCLLCVLLAKILLLQIHILHEFILIY